MTSVEASSNTGTSLGSWTLRGLQMDWGKRTYLMAILNVTPDSFSGDGLMRETPGSVEAALRHAELALSEGADLLDIGGESTRPGAEAVGADTEMRRVVPVIEAIRKRFDAPISIDTSKAKVAEAALSAGADLVNDVWGLRADPELAEVVSRHSVPVVLMHNRSTPKQVEVAERVGGFYRDVAYDDLVEDVREGLLGSVAIATAAGIPPEKLILDPGLGFGKTPAQNLELLDRGNEIASLGYPVLVGSSRKSFIGLTLDLPPDQRIEGTAATLSIAIARGADIVRVHDVREMARVVRMSDAILRRDL